MAGLVPATSPWPCWPMPSWSSPAPRPPAATAQRGTRRPDQGARPAPAHRSRGPPAAGGPGVDSAGPAWLGAGLVTLAPTPSGPSATRTLPATRTASAAGVLSALPALDPQPPPILITRRTTKPTKSLLNAGMVGAGGVEPPSSSVSANNGEPLCARPFLQVALDRRGRS